MKREHLAILLLMVIFLSTLTLGYGFISYSGGMTKSPLAQLNSGISSGGSGDSSLKNSQSPAELDSLGDLGDSYSHSPPDTDFSFRPTDIHAECPVAILPDDPKLVCTDSPAVSIPLFPGRRYSDWRMIVWYPGIYYLPSFFGKAQKVKEMDEAKELWIKETYDLKDSGSFY